MTDQRRRRFWAWPWELQRCGILGMNRRNAGYILPYNPRDRYPQVDDKLLTKRICEAHGIPVPETYAVIERQGDLRRFADVVSGREGYVVKPTQGSEGRGILVIAHCRGDHWVTAGGEPVSLADMQYHLSAILSGLYSLGGRPDRVVVEQRIQPHAAFDQIAVDGTPDIRILAYRGVPAMAMIRLPTRESRGRANLHQGAVATGIELHTGRTTGGVWKSRMIDLHPDTQRPVAGFEVPHWNQILGMSIRLAKHLELGYIGLDFVLDQTRGPVILEANARPGLAIQLANRRGLLPRLDLIDAQLANLATDAAPTDRLELLSGLLARLAEV